MTAAQLGALIMLTSALAVASVIVAVCVYVTVVAAICVTLALAILSVESFAWLVRDALGRAVSRPPVTR